MQETDKENAIKFLIWVEDMFYNGGTIIKKTDYRYWESNRDGTIYYNESDLYDLYQTQAHLRYDDTMTEEIIEEHVELIDWSIVPMHLITENIREKFKSIKGLQSRIWLEDILEKLTFNPHESSPVNLIYFHILGKIYITYDFSKQHLSVSKSRIWNVLNKQPGINPTEIRYLLRNVIKNKYKDRTFFEDKKIVIDDIGLNEWDS